MATEVYKMITDTDVNGTYIIQCGGMPNVAVHLTITGDTTIKIKDPAMATILNLMLHNDNVGGHTILFDLTQLAVEGAVQPAFSTVADECNSFIFMGSSGTDKMHIMSKPEFGIKHGV